MARVINSSQCQLSIAGFDDYFENWMVLYVCIVTGMTVDESWKAYDRGRRKRHDYKWWTTKEIQILKRELAKGTPTRQIANMLNRNTQAVSRYIYQNRKRGNLD